jgi:hypothetical protein
LTPELRGAFTEKFGETAYKALQEPILKALAYVQARQNQGPRIRA